MCNSNKCAICECEDNEIPLFWKKQQERDESEMKTMSYDHRLDFSNQRLDESMDGHLNQKQKQ